MSRLSLGEEDRFSRIATLDIETDGFDGTQDNLVAIGVGYYSADGSGGETEVVTRGSVGSGELNVIEEAFSWINERKPEALVTYNGVEFDFEFLNDKMDALSVGSKPSIKTGKHIDLYLPRKRAASRENKKWPRLEECLAAYDFPIYETVWRGAVLDNTRFGEELAPEYLSTLESGAQVDELESIIYEYTASDVEANIAIYEADVGREYAPTYEFPR